MIQYQINHLDEAAVQAAHARWDSVAKPLRSLGALEELLSRVAGIQGTADVRLRPRCVTVFCADHGVVAEGVTQTGAETTALVARSIAEGSANVNLMAKAAQTDVFAIDIGMRSLPDHPKMISRRIAAGTRNMAEGPAMARDQAEQAVQVGMDLVGELHEKGYQLIATGEMGIGNTTACAALCCALLGLTPEETVHRGAGLSDTGLARKTKAVRRALEVNQPDPKDPLDVLSKVGGFEIAAMAGAFLGGMTFRVPVIMDGYISSVAALIAAGICPAVRDFILPSHLARAKVMRRILAELNLDPAPVIHANMALGEGTGAVALLPLLDMAWNVYSGPHTFEGLGMEAYTPQGGAI